MHESETLMKEVTVGAAGICCLDYLVRSPWPARQGTEVRVKDMTIQGGGLVGTAAVAAARLGAKCRLWSLLGEDAAAEPILEGLRQEQIDVGGVQKVKGGSPFSFIHVDETSGERTIFHHEARGLKRDFGASLAGIAECEVLLIDDYYLDLSLAAAAAARKAGVPVVADATPGERNRDLLRRVDVMIAPQEFVRVGGFGEKPEASLDAIHAMGPTTAVITMGRKGCMYSERTGRGTGRAYEVQAVDTTGAGDVFHGAFAFAMAQKWELGRCADFAAATAAIKCTKPGGRTGIPTLKTVLDFLKANSSLDWKHFG